MKQRQRISYFLPGILVAFLLLSSALLTQAQSVTKQSFGKTADGENVDLYTLRNTRGAEAKIMNYGGIVVSLKVPDRSGKFDDVVLGFNDLDSYLKGHPYFGAIIGR